VPCGIARGKKWKWVIGAYTADNSGHGVLQGIESCSSRVEVMEVCHDTALHQTEAPVISSTLLRRALHHEQKRSTLRHERPVPMTTPGASQ
jgi:hypothetical protein